MPETRSYRHTAEGTVNQFLRGIRVRCRQHKLRCDLDKHKHKLIEIVRHGHCCVCGRKFRLARGRSLNQYRQRAPSPDRKIAGGDYIWKNIRIVCVACNIRRGDRTMDEDIKHCYEVTAYQEKKKWRKRMNREYQCKNNPLKETLKKNL